MTVFAVHETRNDDVTPALRFGQIRYINKFYIHGDELEHARTTDHLVIPRGYAANIDRAADAFDPASDYLLISGDHLQLLAMTAVLAGRFDSFNVLRWDRQIRDYIPIRLSSGLVPLPDPVLSSNMASQREPDIGETHDAEETRRNAHAVALESPVRTRRDADREFLEHHRAPKRTP